MNEEMQPILWLIDENEKELRIHQKLLQKAMSAEGAEITVTPLSARPHIGDYYDILQNPQTIGIVVDQRLNEVRGIDHTGIELAKRLRDLVPKLPIYILTNYANSDEFIGGEWSVDDILSKRDMQDVDKRKTFVTRLLRHVDIHQDILNARAARFHELLKKWLESELTAKEQKEFDTLRIERVAVIASSEVDKLKRLEDALTKVKHLRTNAQG